MRTSELIENPLDPKAAMGAATLSKAVGGTAAGATTAKALDTLGQGKSISGAALAALEPYADALNDIIANPKYRVLFKRLIDTVKADKAKEQAAAQPQESIQEDQDSVDAVAGAITRRIMMQHTDLLSKYGPVKVMAAIDDVADFAGSDGLDEIGSSDVSIWTKQVIQDLEAGHYDRVEEAPGDYTVKTISAADAWKKHTEPKKSKSKVPVDPKSGKTLYQKVTSEEVEENDVVDTVTLDVPLLLRIMEYAREDAQEDMDLHDVAERMITMSKDGPLSMDDYDAIVSSSEDQIEEEYGMWKVEFPKQHVGKPVDAGSVHVKAQNTAHAHKVAAKRVGVDHKVFKSKVTKSSILPEDQLDELSPQTLGSYVAKSAEDEKRRRAKGIELRDRLRAATGKMFTAPMDRKLHSPTASRKAGQKRAIDKLTGVSKVPAKESYYTPGPETMPGAVGPQENTTVSFNQSKTVGDATLNISASAKDMEELHRILKLAGIDYNAAGAKEEPSMKDVAVALAPHAPEEPAEEPCGCDDAENTAPTMSVKPLDLKYTTDKTALINAIKDKLATRLS